MPSCDTLIRNASVLDGTGAAPEIFDVALDWDRICNVGPSLEYSARVTVDATGLSLSPGFIDVHTHDDTSVIRSPAMLPKLSQGVTTVIVGNCGISASPVRLHGEPPDPSSKVSSGKPPGADFTPRAASVSDSSTVQMAPKWAVDALWASPANRESAPGLTLLT